MPEPKGKIQRSQIANKLREARHSAKEVVGSIRFCVEDPHVGLRQILRELEQGDQKQFRRAHQRCDHLLDHLRRLDQHLEFIHRLESVVRGDEPLPEEPPANND